MASFTDSDIKRFIEEPKTLPLDWVSKMKCVEKNLHKELSIDVRGDLELKNENDEIKTNMYKILLRQHKIDSLNFTAIFSFYLPYTGGILNMKRYCGKYHQHTNKIEGTELPIDFHIHTITHRYQKSSFENDTFAEITNRYNDLNGALNCLLKDCNFKLAQGQQLPLNGWVSI
jgi:hypothetical protein